MITKILLTAFLMVIMVPWVQSTFETPDLWSDPAHTTLTVGWIAFCVAALVSLCGRIWRGR